MTTSVDSLLFSVLIPTYNRPQKLSECLNSFTYQNFSNLRWEIIVVDDGSYKSIEPVLEKFQSQIKIRMIRQPNAGPASARNTGAAAAQGEYLVFTDDDCQPHPDWLKTLAAVVKDFPNALIGGHTINALADNLYSSASQLLIDYIYDYYNQQKGQATFFTSNNFALPRELYQKLGGFDTSFPLAAGEDREFCDRWLQYGNKMVYAPEVQVYHAHKLTLSSYWRQHFFYGRGAFCFHQVRAKRAHTEIKVEPISFYLNLLKYPLSQPTSQPKLLLSALLFISQVAGVAGFFWERSHRTFLNPVLKDGV